MKYITHNSSNVVTKATTDLRAKRLQQLQARLVAARELVKSDVGPSLYKVYDHKDNLIEWRQDTGWRDVE
jgi:hypothetical protein|tara:strand:+ start:48 stop:257 length:210 start_codon:yes stop_codon:yes gene_type:complete